MNKPPSLTRRVRALRLIATVAVLVAPACTQEPGPGATLPVAIAHRASADDPAGIEAEIHRTGSVVLYGVSFDDGTADLQAASEKPLAAIVKVMTDRSDWRFEVQSHTDEGGTKLASLALSGQRARAVVSWLTAHGIGEARLVSKGYGDTVPLAGTTSQEGRATYRRVELKKLNEE